MLNKCLINAFVIKLILMTANINAETVFIFNHGLGGNKNQIKFYQMPNKANWDILGQRTVSFDFPEVSGDGNINMNNANLAQDKDIEALDIVYKECLKDKNVDKIILVGVSRGASVAIAYASRHPEKLAGMVLESPFDSIDKIIKYQLNQKYIGWIPGLRFIAHSWIANVYKAYDKNGIQPIDVVKSLPKDLPILFVHSKQDKLISVKSSRRLHKKLMMSGNKHVYLLELNQGEHAQYQLSSDANNYQTVVHAFFKKYGIEHREDLAKLGEILLSNINVINN